MKKWLVRIGIFLLIIILGILAWAAYNMRDRHPGYEVDLHISANTQKVQYRMGFAKQKITPTVTETWNDVDGDAHYREENGDTFNDTNGNGKFDAIWIAGFHNGKPAQGVHDDVWARAVVMDDGTTRMALVALDAVGFMYTDVVDIREMVPAELEIDYVLIASTHTHESNDLIGIWGPDEFHSGCQKPDRQCHRRSH